eukprot:4703308-Amphidinium_carterae.1
MSHTLCVDLKLVTQLYARVDDVCQNDFVEDVVSAFWGGAWANGRLGNCHSYAITWVELHREAKWTATKGCQDRCQAITSTEDPAEPFTLGRKQGVSTQ